MCFSALKYSTAVPVIFLSALKYHVFPDRWTNFYQPLWLLSSVVNSLYSFYWDIARDWDLRYGNLLHFEFSFTLKSNKFTFSSILIADKHWSLPHYLFILISFSPLIDSGFTRIFKFSRPSLVSYLLYGRKWVRTKDLVY